MERKFYMNKFIFVAVLLTKPLCLYCCQCLLVVKYGGARVVFNQEGASETYVSVRIRVEITAVFWIQSAR